MKKISLIVLLLTTFTLSSFACICTTLNDESLQRFSYEHADIVFLGELIPLKTENDIYKFKVFESFKGNKKNDTIIGSVYNTCSILPKDKGLWLIYANFYKGDTIDISICLASRSFKNPYLSLPPPPKTKKEYKKEKNNKLLRLKREFEKEKAIREDFTELIAELERLRFLNKQD